MFFVKQQSFASKCVARYNPSIILDNTDITVSIENTTKNHTYDVFVKNDKGITLKHGKTTVDTASNDYQPLRFSISALSPGIYYLGAVDLSSAELCFNPEAKILVSNITGTKNSTCLANIEGFGSTSIPVFNIGKTPELIATGSAIDIKQQYKIYISDTSSVGDYTYNGSFTIRNEQPFPKLIAQLPLVKNDGSPLANGTHIVTLSDSQNNALCSTQFAIGTIGAINQLPTPTSPLPQCQQWEHLNGDPIPTGQESYVPNEEKKCAAVSTGLGINIGTDPPGFIKSIFGLILSLSGGIAVFLIMRAGFKILMSKGNQEELNEGREQLAAAIVGLLFIIFSLVILQVVGVDLLHIPGFGK